MKIPKILKKDNKKYKFLKNYENFLLYESETCYKECFMKHDLGLIKERVKPRNSNPQKVSYL